MRIHPRQEFSPDLQAMLRKAELDHIPAIEADAAEFLREKRHCAQQHPELTGAQLEDRVFYRFACKQWKIPQIAADQSNARGIVDAQSRDISLIHAHLRELTAAHEHLPFIARELQRLGDTLHEEIKDTHALTRERLRIMQEAQDAAVKERALELANLISIRNAAVLAVLAELRGFARKAAWGAGIGLGILLLAIVLATVFAPRARAQLLVKPLQSGSVATGTQKQCAGGVCQLDYTNCTVTNTASNHWTINCAGVLPDLTDASGVSVTISVPLIITGGSQLTCTDASAPSAPSSGQTILYCETSNGIASISPTSVKKYMVRPLAPTAGVLVTGLAADGTLQTTSPTQYLVSAGIVSGGLCLDTSTSQCYAFFGAGTSGLTDTAGNYRMVLGTVSGFLNLTSGYVYGLSSSATAATTAPDVAWSRLGAAAAAFGNGTQGDFSATVKATTFNAVTGFQVNGAALACSHLSDASIYCAATGAKNAQTGTYQVLAADFTNLKVITVASGTFTITLVASGSQPANGKFINIINYGSGTVTVARSGQNINGGASSLTIAAGSATAPTGAYVVSDGTDYFANVYGGGGGSGTVTSVATTSPIGGGTITTTGTITCTTCLTATAPTNHGVLLGAGTQAVGVTAVGATNTVLHGNSAADPTYSAVVEADITTADNTTDDVATTKHGFAPKAPNDTTKFLRGDATWAVPAAGSYNPLDFTTYYEHTPFGANGSSGVVPFRWTTSGSASGGSVVTANGSLTGYPSIGFVQLTTGATAGARAALTECDYWSLGYYCYPSVSSNTNWEMDWVIALGQTTATGLYAGFSMNTAPAHASGSWIGVRYDTAQADTKFTFETCNAGTCTVTASAITADTSNHHLKIYSSVAGTIKFQVDSDTVVSISTNVPTGTSVPFILLNNAATAANKTANLMGYAIQFTGLSL